MENTVIMKLISNLYIYLIYLVKEKVSRFLMSGMWKLSLDVEIEPAVENKPS